MPNIIFYLNTGALNKSNGTAPIMAKIIFNNKRYYKTITRIKATPEIKDSKGKITAKGDWNLKKSRVAKNHKNLPYNRHNEINATINQLESLMLGFNDYCSLNPHKITEQDIINILDGKDPVSGNKAANRPEISFDQAYLQWLEHTKSNNSNGTYIGRKSVYKFYSDFQTDTKNVITFQNLNMIMFDQLKQYSFKTKKHNSNNFAKIIKMLKIFLNWCKARELYSGQLPKEFKANERDITHKALTFDEFNKLYNFDFKSLTYQKVRDIFCFGCVTGLRYSDLQALRWEWINDNKISITLQKVKEPVKIPLLDYALKILARYPKKSIHVLPRMSNQKFNEYLKLVCEEAKIDRPINIDNDKKNEFIQTTLPIHKAMTAHVSRKTFITISFRKKMDIRLVMKITGIKNERTLRKYNDIGEDMVDEELKKAWVQPDNAAPNEINSITPEEFFYTI